MIDFIQVGKKISYYRKISKMSQDELADMLFITRQALSKWENGSSVPSIDSLLQLCNIFNTSFEELLCLNEHSNSNLDINSENIFQGYNRKFIIKQILSNNLDVNIPDVFYQFSPNERMLILKAIKENQIPCNLSNLWIKLTPAEQKFLGGKSYTINRLQIIRKKGDLKWNLKKLL